MPKLTKESVIQEFSDIYGQRNKLIADCEENPEIAKGQVEYLEQIRSLGVTVEIGDDYLELIDEVISEVSVIASKEYCREYYANDPEKLRELGLIPKKKKAKGKIYH